MFRTLLLLGVIASAAAQVAVVDANIRDTIDRTTLRNLLLGQTSTWSDGSQVLLVLASDEASRAAIKDLTGRDLDRLLRSWKRIVFSGNGAMPVVAASTAEAAAIASQRAGAIAILGSLPVANPRLRVAFTFQPGGSP
ncbi:MAG TPA: hypothetical protein VHX44_18080 [Planctomycetota bacterium]|nr:hypothetical protein [Planctomycetota bacterium]